MSTEQSKEPTQCTRGCGFYGNEASGGMCSKCARDTSDDGDAAQLPSPESTTTVSTPPPSPESMSRTQPAAAAAASTPPTAVAHTPSALSLASAAAVPSQSPATNASAAAAAASSLSPRPKSAIQKKKNRCFSKGCRIKLSMVEQQTNKCICGYTFCVKHRHPEEHSCAADHMSPGKKRLASANQRVVHDKVDNRI